MKRFRTLTLIIALTTIISACGAEPAPTANPIDIQNTAVAAALTIIAQTQAAIPTATPVPPTETPTQTPLPTNTPLALPTLDASPTVAPAANNSDVDPCATRVLGSPKGKDTRIRIDNTTKVPITISLYLNLTEGQGECGYRAYNIPKSGYIVIDDLVQGCYNIWAWSDDPKGRFNSGGYGCINNTDKWTFEVNTATVKLIGP